MDVASDGRHLVAHLLAEPPQDLAPGNVRVVPPAGARPVEVIGIDLGAPESLDAPDRDLCLTVRLDRPGDGSCYTLELVEADQHGHPTGTRLAQADPRFAAADFSFTVNCPTDLDCSAAACGCGGCEGGCAGCGWSAPAASR